MPSSQTKDTTVDETMWKLQQNSFGINTICNNTKPSHKILNALIYKVRFHSNKTRYINETTDILASKYQGDIPSTAEKLMALPSVGPKMAFNFSQIKKDWAEGTSRKWRLVLFKNCEFIITFTILQPCRSIEIQSLSLICVCWFNFKTQLPITPGFLLGRLKTLFFSCTICTLIIFVRIRIGRSTNILQKKIRKGFLVR